MYELQEAALSWTDPEGVHSMRVASRRLRSALRDFMPYVRKRDLASIQKQIRSLADALGEVRDQDVAIMALEKIAKHAPAEVSTTLKDDGDGRMEIREQARKELTSRLERPALEELQSSFTAAVDHATTTNDSEIAYRKMSREIILERLQELEELSNDLFDPFEV